MRKLSGNIIIVVILIVGIGVGAEKKYPPSIEKSKSEPVKYIGNRQTNKYFYDGKVPHAAGVHNLQVFRANRSNPTEGGLIGWTFSHAPMLAFWNGKFYLQYLSNLKEEHGAPGRTLLATSENGYDWTNPKVVFPVYPLPEIDAGFGYIPKGMASVMHQRMGFYVAPNGKLLTIGFYSYCATPRHSPNRGQGLGRVVREIYKDGSFGPIYFIRYNRHAGWNESNTDYPFYNESGDQEFIRACDDLLADKPATLQWWEMDRAKDGFYTIDMGEHEIKALCYYKRPDDIVVGLWKNNLAALTFDNGKTWTNISTYPTLKTCGAKVWGQKTKDDRYALIYNHSASLRNRFPLVVITGEDGHRFDDMLCINGQVPPMRYQGIHKSLGPQYIRGIVPGNGRPPGKDIWITYSVNKEDVWVSKIKVPVTGIADEHINESFDEVNEIADLTDWSFYVPKWAPLEITSKDDQFVDNVLRLTDEDPYDYLRVEKLIPESKKLSVKFSIKQVHVGPAKLEFEVHDIKGERPLRLLFSEEWLMFDRGPLEIDPVEYSVGEWRDIELKLDCETQSYDVYLDKEVVKEKIPFAVKTESLQRIVFRTGPWRGDVRPFIVDGEPGNPGLYQEDLPGADFKVGASIFEIDNIQTINDNLVQSGE